MKKDYTEKTEEEQKHWTPLLQAKDSLQQVKKFSNSAQMRSPTYRLAYIDQEFMMRPELRSQRIGLEFLKPEMTLQECDIQSTVVLFGGARIPKPGKEAWAAKNETQKKNLHAMSHYYDEAREFARLCSCYSATTEYREFVVVTGGGPGIMEAGSRGAVDVGAPTVGLNVVLPHEQEPNSYVTPHLCFNFHYLGIRKMHFLMRAKALAIFPGGFGTLDELFETLTLIQTGRMKRVPILLFGKEFWDNVINFDYLSAQGTISPSDVDLVKFVDAAAQAFEEIRCFYKLP
ncbi:3-isopropylmalate dehydrogenase [Bartonella henselae]|uniref:AMP nucleosidase n=1 Tax=Bartonella henselae (strain ATCC 49882 / DSM 28221 / CCUG 30454 / Houston 1) TaxID=283166 RepID=A0A0H3LVR4_BARHE|nr:LOG family protein [Bartonella henselae]ATP11722.1 3-isopropylmalate dehydrogenase [Bartonella henselae]ETS09260.1 TIGR00730 family protein [Bartonella henselae JK 50]ETS09417.1 TIGR00730 family protein [Bartonella henselae JK 51]ETS09694.1 TIGR00730 family protein [Bartonella henselae JK 42]ETS12722.1 TIGR00730 family protein [Bartonella henselae JK 41]